MFKDFKITNNIYIKKRFTKIRVFLNNNSNNDRIMFKTNVLTRIL